MTSELFVGSAVMVALPVVPAVSDAASSRLFDNSGSEESLAPPPGVAVGDPVPGEPGAGSPIVLRENPSPAGALVLEPAPDFVPGDGVAPPNSTWVSTSAMSAARPYCTAYTYMRRSVPSPGRSSRSTQC